MAIELITSAIQFNQLARTILDGSESPADVKYCRETAFSLVNALHDYQTRLMPIAVKGQKA